jgi:xylose isomerase
VKLLEDSGYKGPRHFDSHAYRQSNYQDVKAFARGSMRTYMILKEKAARWNADAEIQEIVRAINVEGGNAGATRLVKKFSALNARKLLEARLDRVELANMPLPYERLDQLTMEILMGVR